MQAGSNFVAAYGNLLPRIVPDKGTEAVRKLAKGA
jgi:hypothetical protein